MKVLYVVHNFPPLHWAGTEVYSYNLARTMKKRGHDVLVFTGEWSDLAGDIGGSGRDYETFTRNEGGLDVTYIQVPRLENHMEYRRTEVERVFGDFLETADPDIVHVHHLIGLSMGIVDIVKRRGIPLVSTIPDYWYICPRAHLLKGVWRLEDFVKEDIHLCDMPSGENCPECLTPYKGDLLKNYLKAILLSRPRASEIREMVRNRKENLAIAGERMRFLLDSVSWPEVYARLKRMVRWLNKFDVHVCPSRFLMGKYEEAGIDRERLRYSDYGMDHFETKPMPGDFRPVFIGSPVRHKGLHVLIRAWSIAEEKLSRDVELKIYGSLEADRPYSDMLVEMARGHRIRFMGPFQNTEIATVLGDSTCVIVPSIWYENSPLIIHEAFIAKRPVITSGIGGMKELVEGTGAGLLFPVGDANALAEKLIWMDRHRDRQAEMGRNAPAVKTVEEDASDMEKMYQELTGM